MPDLLKVAYCFVKNCLITKSNNDLINNLLSFRNFLNKVKNKNGLVFKGRGKCISWYIILGINLLKSANASQFYAFPVLHTHINTRSIILQKKVSALIRSQNLEKNIGYLFLDALKYLFTFSFCRAISFIW